MLLALMDCNNFYASCEKAFNPALAGRPVVVLSNNDGCVIARCALSKKLGVPMGAPEFKCRASLAKMGAAVFSSNYALYGDMSARVMATAGALVPAMEVYSIDEAFLDLTGLADPLGAAKQVRKAVLKATGIPVSVGAGPTKTLAKAANRLAKKHPEHQGVLLLPGDAAAREPLLARLDIADVWGIGRKHAARLNAKGVHTALDFIRMPRETVHKLLTITGLHTWLELGGTPCLPLTRSPAPNKAIVSSRSFGRPVCSLEELCEALTLYASRAAEKLRAQRGRAATIQVYLQTNTFMENQPQHSAAQSTALHPPTADTARLVRAGLAALKAIFRPGYRYKKVGVMLSGIENGRTAQASLLDVPEDGRRNALMQTLDAVNAKWGRDTLFCAAAGVKRPWSMRQAKRSPRYTTCWEELPVARAV